MELAIPLLALGGIYVVSNQKKRKLRIIKKKKKIQNKNYNKKILLLWEKTLIIYQT